MMAERQRSQQPPPQRSGRPQNTGTLEKLLNGMDEMRATMQRDMNDRNATGDSITKNAVTALLESLRPDATADADGLLEACLVRNMVALAFPTMVTQWCSPSWQV
jgi:hypothetical protein